MSIGCVTGYDSVLLASELCRMIRPNKSFYLFLFHLHILLLLLYSHDEPSIRDELILRFRLLDPLLLDLRVLLVDFLMILRSGRLRLRLPQRLLRSLV